jgi:hypothetical protein
MSDDELIQQQIEDGKATEGMDADAYRLVFSALKKDPAPQLRDDFAKRIVARAFAPKKSFDWDKFFLFGGIFTFLGISGYAVLATEFTFSLGAFQFLSNYLYFIIFAIVIVVMLQWIDKKILNPSSAQL